jgi:hypothetical protein
MKLNLILLATLFHLSNGFTVTLRGKYTEDSCSVEESPEFKQEFKSCVMPMNPHLGGERKLQSTNPCGACSGEEPKGHFCYTYCHDPGNGRRLSEEGTDTPDLLAVFEDGAYDAVFEDGAYKGNSEATDIAKDIIKCLGDAFANEPCLPDTAAMTLTVTLSL